MDKPLSSLVLGVFILILAMIMWRTTHSFLGWAVLYGPGAFYTIRGLCLIHRSGI